MQGALPALYRAALRAREIARQTNTELVVMKDGVVVAEKVTDEDIAALKREIEELGCSAPRRSEASKSGGPEGR
jgi:hypothetical protein